MRKRRAGIDYYAPHWRALRKAVLAETGGKCERCGAAKKKCQMHLHHKHYRTVGHETREDVELLCVDCHCAEHGRRPPRRRQKRKKASQKYRGLWRPWLKEDRDRMRKLGIPIPKRYSDLD